jgi:hypothetical protein
MKDSTDKRWWELPFRMMRFDPLNDFAAFREMDLEEHARDLRHKYHCNVEWIMANGGSSPGTASTVNFSSLGADTGQWRCLRQGKSSVWQWHNPLHQLSLA